MNFFERYFLNPICTGEGYNIYNTLIYGIILLLFLAGLIKLFEKLKIKVDGRFYLALLPFMLIGPTVRVLVDATVYQKMFLFGTCLTLNTTPGIYFLVFIPTIVFLLISRFIWKDFCKSFFLFGLLTFAVVHLFFLSNASRVQFSFNPFSLPLITAFTFLSAFFFYLISKKFLPFFLNSLPYSLVTVHLFDASTTVVGMYYYGYVEQHVLPNIVISLLGPFAMYALKLAVVPAIIYAFSKSKKPERDLLYLAVFILGIAPGMRNLLRIFLGV